MDRLIPVLPHVNALLNTLATILLACGYLLIRRRREVAHRRVMLAGFLVSIVFLGCYLLYHANTRAVNRFPDYPADAIRYGYYGILITHIVLAAVVPVLAVATIYLGLSGRRQSHRRLARWTFPIWLYVSVTGVLVYAMLYHWYPPAAVL
jgi:uncharacterized membrane protein YozB (DUF420 family)